MKKTAVLDKVQDGGFKVVSCTFLGFVDTAQILLVKNPPLLHQGHHLLP